MTHPIDKSLFDQDGPVEREVGEVYRDLPPLEPSAELDARIRAAVVQEIERGSVGPNAEVDVGEEKPHSCIVLPWWRRPGIPMALAASLLVVVGLGGGWFFTDRFVHQSDSGSFQLAQAPVSDTVPAPAAADLPEKRAKATASTLDSLPPSPHGLPRELSPPLPASPAVEEKRGGAIVNGRLDAAHDHVPDVEAEEPAAPLLSSPPVTASLPASVPGELSSETLGHNGAEQEKLNSVAQDSKPDSLYTRQNAAATPRPAPVHPDWGVSRRGPSPSAVPPDSMDSATLAKLRELLAAGRRDEARGVLKAWRGNHPDISVPEELYSLLKELEAEKPQLVPAQ